MKEEKKKALNFHLRNQYGEYHSLDTYQGKYILLVFIPDIMELKSRIQVMNYKYALAQFHALDTEIIGICGSSMKDIQAECRNLELNFPILNDDACEVRNLYHTRKEKVICGKKCFINQRSAFLIDKQGIIKKVYRQVNVNSHTNSVLEYLENKRTKEVWRSLSRRKKEKIMKGIKEKEKGEHQSSLD